MGKPKVIICQECSDEVEVKNPGRPPRYCPKCRVIVTKRQGRDYRRRRSNSGSTKPPDEPGPMAGEGVAQEPPPTASPVVWHEILEVEGRAVCPRCGSINATITWKMGTYNVDLTGQCPDCKLFQSRIDLSTTSRSTPPAAPISTRSSAGISASPACAGLRTSEKTPTATVAIGGKGQGYI